ncbi:putative phosphoglucosamine mutase [Candidatus Methanoplasma termitum]|uniref:GlmM1 protein n=1 Tax=Candidatus Methanoplasma termitum TaxID=1577791 RepID=A0A0A7LAC9_9ARCH|nr:hypothetical protein [Candidatus Methanoplasma termitum]AIZ56029.1 putative phosphoglucosamine mutase [Candidatus Methanoplasma termitum]MCL2333566.1 hypothetical protein [Candidatus Methanoplasma sp.]
MNNAHSLTLRSITDDDMTAEKALKIGRMIGRTYKNVCIGSDTNPSSKVIKNSLISGLLSAGANVNDAGIAPAPAVALASKGSDCMLMVGEPNEQGVISRIYIMNSDGSMFTKEQIRQLITNGRTDRPLPGYKGIGNLRIIDSVAEDYNRVICNKYPEKIDTPVILDCGCGCTSVCAPQILASLGADVTTINAQNDPQYSPRPPGVSIRDVSNLIGIIDTGLGNIGIALNGDGTRLALINERGKYVDPDHVLALLLLFLKPSSLVVPIDVSAVVEDAFKGIIEEEVFTDSVPGKERQIIRADKDIESITAAIKREGAEMGVLTDGAFIFPNVTLCPDAINAAVILTKMSRDNSLSSLLASFPKYILIRASVHVPMNAEHFNRKFGEKMEELNSDNTWDIDGGRVGMPGGWFAVSRASDNPEYVTITAEAKDKAYAVSMMEFAKKIVRDIV